MSAPRITIGMATYNDFEGVWATIQSVFLHNEWERPTDVELIVVDTSPESSDHVSLVKQVVVCNQHIAPSQLPRGVKTPYGRHVHMPDLVGTTAPRDKIFELATAPVVVVMDCHVMLRSNALLRLLQWFEQRPDCKDIVQGPLIYDDLNTVSTHLADQYRSGMRGTWASIWRSPGGTSFVLDHQIVTDENVVREDQPYARCHDVMTMRPLPVDGSGNTTLACGMVFPGNIEWAGHDRELVKMGCVEVGKLDSAEAVEIPGCGMGFFAARRDAWLGFAKHCSGFGGEELHIHDKYRRAGHKALCLPFATWDHRFGRAGGAPYPHPIDATVRNYVLWAKDLGVSADRAHTHFVKGKMISQEKWNQIVSDPIGYKVDLTPPPVSTGQAPIEDLFKEIVEEPGDLKENATVIRDVIKTCNYVLAVVDSPAWEPVLAAGYPSKLLVVQSGKHQLTKRTHEAVSQRSSRGQRGIDFYQTIPETVWAPETSITGLAADTLVIDSTKTAEHLQRLLDMYLRPSVNTLLIRGTQAYGVQAPTPTGGAGVGLWEPVKRLLAERPDWFIAMHRPHQYGITLLGRTPRQRPPLPVFPWPIGFGPGTELKKMLVSVGIQSSPTCDCNAKMHIMDGWGVQGCRDNRDTIIQWLTTNAERWGWLTPSGATVSQEDPDIKKLSTIEKLAIGWRSIRTGIAFQVNWMDPFPGLVDEAIRRAEANLAVN